MKALITAELSAQDVTEMLAAVAEEYGGARIEWIAYQNGEEVRRWASITAVQPVSIPRLVESVPIVELCL